VLAIVTYRQPITRPEIDSIRGVNSDSSLNTLLRYGLIEETGRTSGPGRPILYGTSGEFLQHFGLSSLEQLPEIEVETQEAPLRAAGSELSGNGDVQEENPGGQDSDLPSESGEQEEDSSEQDSDPSGGSADEEQDPSEQASDDS